MQMERNLGRKKDRLFEVIKNIQYIFKNAYIFLYFRYICSIYLSLISIVTTLQITSKLNLE